METIIPIGRILLSRAEDEGLKSVKYEPSLLDRTITYLRQGLTWTQRTKAFSMGHPQLHALLGSIHSAIPEDAHLTYQHYLYAEEPFTLALFLIDQFPAEPDASPDDSQLLLQQFSILRAVLTVLSDNNRKDFNKTLKYATEIFECYLTAIDSSILLDDTTSPEDMGVANSPVARSKYFPLLFTPTRSSSFTSPIRLCALLLFSLQPPHSFRLFATAEQHYRTLLNDVDPSLNDCMNAIYTLVFADEPDDNAPPTNTNTHTNNNPTPDHTNNAVADILDSFRN